MARRGEKVVYFNHNYKLCTLPHTSENVLLLTYIREKALEVQDFPGDKNARCV
jgi:hypothetical protein